MPKRISAADRTPIRVVVVTMDSHLGGAFARAKETLHREMPGLHLAMHAADEWGSDDAALAECHADIARADIVVATMLFLEDHIRAVLPALAARQPHCDAMLCCMSAGEVMRLTRIGKFSMAGEATGALAMLKRLRGKPAAPGDKQGLSATAGARQMKMLRRLPALLRFIPGTAQDVRAYFLSLQYWLGGSEDNIANLLRMLVDRYADGPRRPLRGTRVVAAPKHYPDVGLYHPRANGRVVERLDQLPSVPRDTSGTVGVLLMRAYVLSSNSGHYDGAIAALEAQGLRVIPAFASGLDQRPAIEQFFLRDGVPTVDAVVSLTGFSLVGGPAYNDARAAEATLARLDVPYISAHPLEFQTLAQWGADARGLLPVEATMMVAIPELDGGILPMTFGGRCGVSGTEDRCEGCDGTNCARDMVPHLERSRMLAARVAKLVTLRRSARAERRVAIVLFNFPPNGGAAGTAAYLGVFASLLNTLRGMKAQGYTVEVPETEAALRAIVLEGNAKRFGTDANVVTRIPADDLRSAPARYTPDFLATYLQLPKLDPRIPLLARQITGKAANATPR